MGRKRKKKQPSATLSGGGGGEDEDEDCASGPSGPTKKSKLRCELTENDIDDSSYYFEKGLRKVRPYFFKFQTHCKGRWVGRTLRDVYEKEFRTASTEYWSAAVALGRVTLNGEPTSLDSKVTHNDVLAHTVHRHEHPVSDAKIGVIVDDERVLVVNKPSSLPIHPSGRFRHNSLTHILQREYGYKNLHTIHRIDRLTSGIVMFAKSLVVSQKLDKLVREHILHKEYLCKVDGIFPSEPVVCKEPVKVFSHKLGLCRVHPDGKDSETRFQLLHTQPDTQTSIVKCLPRTGRMHQIRVHLLHLGFPIVNDPLYNHSIWKENVSDEQIVKTLQETYQHSVQHKDPQEVSKLAAGHQQQQTTAVDTLASSNTDTTEKTSSVIVRDEIIAKDEVIVRDEIIAKDEVIAKEEVIAKDDDIITNPETDYDSICLDCKRNYSDPEPHELIMYLHALKYKGPDFEYETDMPTWAQVGQNVNKDDVSVAVTDI